MPKTKIEYAIENHQGNYYDSQTASFTGDINKATTFTNEYAAKLLVQRIYANGWTSRLYVEPVTVFNAKR